MYTHVKITGAWWMSGEKTESEYPSIKIRFTREDEKKDRWDLMPITLATADKWKPFLRVIGCTILDIKKHVVIDDDHEEDDRIMSIGDWKPGGIYFVRMDKGYIRRWIAHA